MTFSIDFEAATCFKAVIIQIFFEYKIGVLPFYYIFWLDSYSVSVIGVKTILSGKVRWLISRIVETLYGRPQTIYQSILVH